MDAQNPAPLTDSQTELIRKLVQQPGQVMAHVSAQLKYWTLQKQSLAAVNSEYKSQLDPTDAGTLGQLDLFLMEEMLAASKHVDVDYVKDLSQGFPVTGRLPDGDCGRPIPGGQRVHGTPGLGGPEPIEALQEQCYSINQATLKAAQSKKPKTPGEWELAREAWKKLVKDRQQGYAGEPLKVSEIDLHNNLLVDTFGIYERHAGQDWKVRLINNFKRNTVNQYAWLPSKLSYDNFDQLLHAARTIKEGWKHDLEIGKADFKSAFKTLPPFARPEVALLVSCVRSRTGRVRRHTNPVSSVRISGSRRSLVQNGQDDPGDNGEIVWSSGVVLCGRLLLGSA